MRQETVYHYALRLKLLEMGETAAAKELCDLVDKPVVFNEKEGSNKEGASFFLDNSADVQAQLKLYEERYKVYKRNPNRVLPDSFSRALQQEVVDEFSKAAASTRACGNCSAISPSIRKDGWAKIFMRPLRSFFNRAPYFFLFFLFFCLYGSLSIISLFLYSARVQKTNDAKKFKYKSALEHSKHDTADQIEDSDDDYDHIDNDDGTITENDKYLVPLEVQAQLSLLWGNNSEILNLIWCSLISLISHIYHISHMSYLSHISHISQG